MELAAIDHTGSIPPFEQLRMQIAAQVASGELSAGTRLPTVRALAEQVGLAVNTVARVFRELEADGVVVTEGRRGTFVRSSSRVTADEAQEAAATYAAVCRQLGLSAAEAGRLLDQHWHS
jgi:DNA-binding transcriptional regulator YhcF (GntR family)